MAAAKPSTLMPHPKSLAHRPSEIFLLASYQRVFPYIKHEHRAKAFIVFYIIRIPTAVGKPSARQPQPAGHEVPSERGKSLATAFGMVPGPLCLSPSPPDATSCAGSPLLHQPQCAHAAA